MQVETNTQQVFRHAGLAWLRLMAFGLLLMVVSPWAQATTGRVVHNEVPLSSGGSVKVSQAHETNLMLRREVKNSMGEIIQYLECWGAGQSCFGTLPSGADTYAITVHNFDSNKYEIISESCGGLVSTIPQLQCINGAYSLSLRLRLGYVEVRNAYIVGQSTLGTMRGLLPGAQPRLNFVENADKYWGNFALTSSRQVPAGSYTLSGMDRLGPCKPVQTNTNDAFTVPPGGTVTFTVVYRMTECTVEVKVNYTSLGTNNYTLTDANGASFACSLYFQTFDLCTAKAPYGNSMNIGLTAPSGYGPSFDAYCQTYGASIPVAGVLRDCKLPMTRDDSFDVTIVANGAPPPPPPTVTLSIQDGAQSPIDRQIIKGASDVSLLQLLLTPNNGSARLDSLNLASSGTGRDDLDLTELRLIHDANANGQFDVGETLLASGSFSADNGSMSFVLGTPLVVSASTHVLVVADVAGSVTSASLWLGGGASLIMLGALGLPGGWGGGSGGSGNSGSSNSGGNMLLRLWRRLHCLVSPRTRERERMQAHRQRMAHLGVLVLSTAMLASCGGSDPAVEAASPAPTPVPAPAPSPTPAPPPPSPAPPALTYQVRVTAVRAVDATTPTTVISVGGVPITGATISVQP